MRKLYKITSEVEFYNLSAETIEYLIDTGLYGNSRSEVIQTLANKSIEKLVKDGIVPTIEELRKRLRNKRWKIYFAD